MAYRMKGEGGGGKGEKMSEYILQATRGGGEEVKNILITLK